jgi:CBS domain-containing protein
MSTLGDVATTNVISIGPEEGADRAMSLMEDFGIHHLPVVSGGEVIGMVSDRDLLISVGWWGAACGTTLPSANASASGDSLRGRCEGVGGVEDVEGVEGVEDVEGVEGVGDVEGVGSIDDIRVAALMTTPAMCVSLDTDLGESASILLERRIHALPLLWERRLVGILTDTDIVRFGMSRRLDGRPRCAALDDRLSDVMGKTVVWASPEDSVFELADLLRFRRLHHLPICVPGSPRRLLGIVSDRDVRRALAQIREAKEWRLSPWGATPSAPRAMDIMKREVFTTRPQELVSTAIEEMLGARVHCLPITEVDIESGERRLSGIYTSRDALRLLVTCGALE